MDHKSIHTINLLYVHQQTYVFNTNKYNDFQNNKQNQIVKKILLTAFYKVYTVSPSSTSLQTEHLFNGGVWGLSPWTTKVKPLVVTIYSI